MTKFLVGHNIEGQAEILWGTMTSEGWRDILPMKMFTFQELGLKFDSTDREVWRFAQANGMILLTDNCNTDDEDSLERTIREENRPTSRPIITIGTLARIDEKDYRIRCVTRIAEIVIDPENALGTGRLYVP